MLKLFSLTTKRNSLLLFLFFVVGVFFRFYNLSSTPLGLFRDEASIGYNAHSILETGKDEYGKSFPLLFRSFGDYKPPFYIYLTTLSVKLFGLNIFAVRFPSAILGSLTGIVIYFLSLEIFKNRKFLAIVSSLIFWVSPWSILFSRGAFEANIALFFFLLAIYFQIKAIESRKKWPLVLSILNYVIATYTYHAEKILSPIFLIYIFLIYLKRGKKTGYLRIKTIIFSFIFFLFLSFPQYFLMFTNAGNNRVKNLSVVKIEDIKRIPTHPEIFLQIIKRPISLYVAYFSPRNLFFYPDSDPQHSFPELSVFYFWMIIPYFLGIFFIFRSEEIISKKLALGFLFLSPIPASLTGDPFSTVRALPLIFPLSVLIGMGLEKSFIFFKNKIVFMSLLIVFFCLSLLMLTRNLFYLLPQERYLEWNYGYTVLSSVLSKYKNADILIDDFQGVSYIHWLFFTKYPPSLFQRQVAFNLSNYYKMSEWKGNREVGKVSFKNIIWGGSDKEKDILVATPIGISETQAREHFLTKLYTIKGPDKRSILDIYITERGIQKYK